MNKLTLSSVLGAASLLFGLVSSANAQVITFDGLGLNVDDPVTVDGFVFDYQDMTGWAIGVVDSPDYTLANEFDTGSDIITCQGSDDNECKIVMTSSSGTLFSLTSFDGADGLFDVGGRTITVWGTRSTGGLVTAAFTTVANTFTTYNLSQNFNDLVSVEFRGFGPGDDIMALDNINVQVVPLPAAAWLLGSGLLGLIAFARRKRA